MLIKFQVEYAKDFGDENKPRSWSKYSKDSSAFQSMEAAKKQKADEKDPKQVIMKIVMIFMVEILVSYFNIFDCIFVFN